MFDRAWTGMIDTKGFDINVGDWVICEDGSKYKIGYTRRGFELFDLAKLKSRTIKLGEKLTKVI